MDNTHYITKTQNISFLSGNAHISWATENKSVAVPPICRGGPCGDIRKRIPHTSVPRLESLPHRQRIASGVDVATHHIFCKSSHQDLRMWDVEGGEGEELE